MKRRLLLISSSRTHGTSFLEHCREAIIAHFSGIERVVFVPYALSNRDAYARLCRAAFEPMGFKVDSLHDSSDPVTTIANAQALFTGGGNTFRLLATLYELNLIVPLRQAILGGTPYMGSSAGTNIVCPTIQTTNDMPIVEPPSFTALNAIPFQINPHFIDADPGSTHQGETREKRLSEYLEENETPVLGIREGCWLNIDGSKGSVNGRSGAVLFQRNQPPQAIESGGRLDHLLVD
jgi:dipeptidase E